MELVSILFTITFFLVVVYMSLISLDSIDKKLKQGWTFKITYFKKRQRLNEINERYEALRKSRKEMLHHFYWAQSCGEKVKEKNMEKEIFRVDDELDELREQYQLVQQGKFVPLKRI